MTAREAQILQTRITAAQGWVMWFILSQPSGMFAARAIIADHSGGHQKGDELVADTLEELRKMLPAGLTRWDRTMMMPADVVETWD
ncbi:MAG: hypothetical protein ACRYG8_05675 [Janthinobacterium lividum]